MRLFVDTGAWIALADQSDQYHAQAVAALRQLGPSESLHTSNYIVGETITRLRRTAGHHVAWQWAQGLRASHLLRVHYADEAVDQAALRIFKKYADQSLSFTDCSTAAFMEQLGLERIFAFDDDFRTLGYLLVP